MFLQSLSILFACYFWDSSKGSLTFYRAGPRNRGNKSKFAMIEKIGNQSGTENSWLKGEKKNLIHVLFRYFFLKLLGCRGEVLLSTCASSIFRFDVLVTPQVYLLQLSHLNNMEAEFKTCNFCETLLNKVADTCKDYDKKK